MNKKLPKIYEPDKYEDRIYQKWEKSGYFNPNKCVKDGIARKDAESFSIVLPPPNRTGVLHIGHALMLVIQDILTRYHRMKGDKTLWVPGTDHAAIATQSVVEKKLYMEEKKTRHDLGREQFLKRVYEFADKSHKTITRQVKKMGSSLDWSREAYTLDEIRTKTVKTVFKMMSDDGLIYRGDRVINWCPRCHSTLADDEVEYKAQKAKLYTFKYSKDFPFNIATTRPETKLGDTAVAVNPKDKRYKKYIGKTYEVDFVGVALKLKIIADRQVDMKFGTGAVGVTPAHSMADWQMAQDHKLEIVKVINEDGNIVDDFDDYSGKSAEQAREMIVKKLKRQGLLEKVEEMENNLSLCYRCHTPIEPLPSLQWFIDVNKKLKVESEKLKVKGEYSLKELSLHVIKSGLIKIIPKRFEKNYFHWMENLRDWCISRQIWFGHRVPVWYCKNAKCKMQNAKLNAKCKNPIVSIKEVEKCPYCDGGVEQDPDTLDTWFSSGLWTFSTLADNPDQIKIQDGKLVIDSDDFKNFHPTSVMETGYDILFFWVARMIIMATYAVGDIPFQDVYLHGLVRDIKGRKMSKSLGNAIDPLDVCAKYGTDAVRLALIIGATPGNDINLSEEKIAGFRNFTNKLWNISRYILKKTDNNIIGVGALIEIKNGKFLFQKRDKNTNRYSDMIAPFGGGLQKHESCLDCLRREIKEELCININNYNISEISNFESHIDYGKYIKLFYIKYVDKNKLELKEGEKIVEMTLQEALKDKKVTNFTKEIINFILQKAKSSKATEWLASHSVADKWILNKMDILIKQVSEDLDNYRFSQAGERLREFTWNDFADWYIEVSKFEQNSEKDKILMMILRDLLKLWHPFMPFVTETIWSEMRKDEFLMVERWPRRRDTLQCVSTRDAENFELIQSIIIAIRNARSQYRIKPSQKIKAVIYAGNKVKLIKSQAELIKKLRTGVERLEVKQKGGKIKEAIYLTVNGPSYSAGTSIEIYLIISGFDFQAEVDRIEKAIKEQRARIKILEKKLSNKQFIKKAPRKIVNQEKEKLAIWQNKLSKFNEQLNHLK